MSGVLMRANLDLIDAAGVVHGRTGVTVHMMLLSEEDAYLGYLIRLVSEQPEVTMSLMDMTVELAEIDRWALTAGPDDLPLCMERQKGLVVRRGDLFTLVFPRDGILVLPSAEVVDHG